MWKELLHKIKQLKTHTAWKATKYAVFSGPYFPEFRLNTERYGVSLRIQSECGKIQTRKNFVFGHFSRSVSGRKLIKDDIMTKKCGFILVFPVFLSTLSTSFCSFTLKFTFFISKTFKSYLTFLYISKKYKKIWPTRELHI